jgi:hypothetical protein
MTRRAHNRKNGNRWPSGNIKPPTAEERANFQKQIEEAEMQTVINQPHRKGSRDQDCESPLGRFFRANPMIRRQLLDAGADYRDIKRRWMAVRGIPSDLRLNVGTGADPSDETVKKWENKINLVEGSIKQRCKKALNPFLQIVVFEREIRQDQTIAVFFALHAAAIALGKIDENKSPWNC